MKSLATKLLIMGGSILCIQQSFSQTTGENYVKTYTATRAITGDLSIINDKTKVVEAVSYADGLGRTVQSVLRQNTPLGYDFVYFQLYDEYGRKTKTHLPYATTATTGASKTALESSQVTFYQNLVGATDASNAFSITKMENSELNRVLKQGAPGAAWQPDNSAYAIATDRSIKMTQELNVTGEVLLWTYTAPTAGYPLGLVNAGTSNASRNYYTLNTLSKKRTKNEQQNEVIEYIDKSGKTILKRVQFTAGNPAIDDVNYASTYYIYDDYNNLVTVLPPEAIKAITKATSDYFGKTDTEKESLLSRWAFRYVYDGRSRMTMKQVPGALLVYMVYDNRDRLILTQDGVQRSGATNATKYWNFTKYDELNRPILTGIKDTTTTVQLTQAQMQSAVDAHFAKVASKWSEKYVGNVENNMHGYTNKAYPVRTGSTSIEIDPNKYLTVTYYDNYTFRSLWQGLYTYLNESLSETANSVTYTQPATESTLVKGQVTGKKVKILDGGITGAGAWIRSVNYYDDKNRVVQSVSDNITGGTDRSTKVLDFTGKVLKNKTSHSILWKDLVGVEATPAGLTRTLAGAGWSAGAASVDILPNGANGWVEVQVAEMNKLRMIGLSKENTNTSTGSMDYAVNLNLGNYTVYENGVNRGNKATITTGDMIRIERTGSTVKYLKNGLEVYTSAVASSTPLMADATLNEYGATLPNLNFSFKNTTPRSITRRFEYDHAGRLMKTWHQVDAQAEILLSSNTYNELGQLVDKKLHSTVATAVNAKQSIDYRYNIRGWLTKINESDIEVGKNDASNAGEARDYFGMELGYNNDIGVANTSLFNGNISAMKWSKNQGLSTAKESAYNYSYDPMNRITAAAFKEKTTSWNALANNGFSESNYTYDLNGNILTLTRYDQRGSAAPMDNLTMIYSYGSSASQSNKLLKVTDTGDVNAGFLDGATATTEYGYNDNGSMTFDSNKEIKSPISYNYLDLPELLTRGTSNTIRYIYDATGTKLSQAATYNTSKKRTDYIGEYKYENSVLQSISHEEGRISMSNEILVYQNDGDNSIGFTTTSATITPITQNTNQTYLKVVSNGTTARTGLSNVVTLGVVPGERYKIRAKGYRDKGTSLSSNPVYLLVQFNGADKDFPGATLGSALTSEAWTEQIVTIPAAINTLQAGIIWNTTVTLGELFYINDFEVIKLSVNDSPEYQYMLKDHLGNVRVTFTTKETEDLFTATLEDNTQSVEQNQFNHYTRVTNDLYDHTDAGIAYDKVQLLNGGNNSQVGLTKSLSVMPGDIINAEVYAKYFGTTGASGNINAFASALLSAFGLPNPALGEIGTASSAINNYGAFISAGNNPGNNGWPKGFLNILVFDKNYNLVDLAYQQLDGTYVQSGATKAPHQLLSKQVVITDPGYVFIYISNEGSVQQDVYFDDFKVTQTKSPIIATNDYYPFGLKFNSYSRENSLPNTMKLFQGQEHVDELSLNWDSFKWRNYQPDIGRFFNVDPLARKYVYNSPYAFSENKVTAHVELEGLESFSIKNLDLNALRSKGVQQRVAAANQSGASIVKIDGGIHAGGVGGGFKLGPVQANASIRVGTATGSTNSSGNTQVQGSVVALQAGVKAPSTEIGGNVNVLNGKMDITPQGKVSSETSVVNADGKIELPGSGTPELPDKVTVSHTSGESGSKQTTSVSTNGEIGVSGVLGNFWGSITVNVLSAFSYVDNMAGAVGAYMGAAIDNMKNPVSSEDRQELQLQDRRN